MPDPAAMSSRMRWTGSESRTGRIVEAPSSGPRTSARVNRERTSRTARDAPTPADAPPWVPHAELAPLDVGDGVGDVPRRGGSAVSRRPQHVVA